MKGFGVQASLVFVVITAMTIFVMEERVGQAEEPPLVETKEVVISATKTEQPISQVTSSVEVITGEELERRKIKTVVDALRLSPGLAVFSNGGPGTTATVRIRGGSSAQTLVFIDGAVMNSPTLGGFNFANLTTDNIERIEILRGPQSMLWGSDAMGGVINIITKRGRGKPRVDAFAEYGSFASFREGGSVSGQKGPLDFSMALSRWDFTGFSAINFRRGAIERDGFRNWQGSTNLGLALPKDGRLEFKYRWLNGDIDFDTFQSPGFDVFKAKSTSDQHVFSGTYKQPLTSWWDQVVTVTRQTEDLESQRGLLRRNVATGAVSPVFGAGITDKIPTTANRLEWQQNVKIGDPLLLSVGYQFREQLGENIGNFTTRIVSSHAGFAQGQVNLWDRLLATGGVRQDEYNVFGSATTWRVTGAYLHKETNTKLRASYGTGFRAPTVNELFFPNFGNPNLQPEKSQGFDVGIEQTLWSERLRLSATYFSNRFRNLIQTVQSLALCGEDPFFPGFPAFCPVNVGTAKTQGWEVGFDATLVKNRPLIKSLNIGGQYTHTITRDLETAARLVQWPVHQASAVLNYQPFDRLQLTGEFRFVGDRFDRAGNQTPLDSFTVINLAATYEMTKSVEVYGRVDNLFDEAYEERFLFGTPVRSVYGGVRVTY